MGETGKFRGGWLVNENLLQNPSSPAHKSVCVFQAMFCSSGSSQAAPTGWLLANTGLWEAQKLGFGNFHPSSHQARAATRLSPHFHLSMAIGVMLMTATSRCYAIHSECRLLTSSMTLPQTTAPRNIFAGALCMNVVLMDTNRGVPVSSGSCFPASGGKGHAKLWAGIPLQCQAWLRSCIPHRWLFPSTKLSLPHAHQGQHQWNYSSALKVCSALTIEDL